MTMLSLCSERGQVHAAGVNVWLYVAPSYAGGLPLPWNCLCMSSALTDLTALFL